MPYRRCDPVNEIEMKKKRYIGHFTICEKTREIWRIGKELNHPELMLKAREAMAMGKRMHEALKTKAYQEYAASGDNHEE